jgi:2-keto-4-pentenoate hydratase
MMTLGDARSQRVVPLGETSVLVMQGRLGQSRTMAVSSRERQLAAERLRDAVRCRTPCDPIRTMLPEADIDDAYDIQQLFVASTFEGRRVGRKIGLTSPAAQQQMGVGRPDFGVLTAEMVYGDSQPISMRRLLQPRVEAEVAFLIGRDLDESTVTSADVMRATEYVVGAIEVVDSRIRDWDITIVDTVADNASSGLVVLGGAPRRLHDVDLQAITMQMSADGDPLCTGTGAACLGHPINAVVWLANEVSRRGAPLHAGEFVLSGSLGPLVAVQATRTYLAEFEGLGTVRAVFTE